jgi:hypothetical protein
MSPSKTLVMGWFSFERYGATAGDLMACDVACRWLEEAGQPYEVAMAPPFTGGVDWQAVDPADYSRLLFVCGPFGSNVVTEELLRRFAHCRRSGLNLTMLDPLGQWNPFDFLLERDSDRCARPDISLLSAQEKVPVVGLVLVLPQKEYRDRGRHEHANAMIRRLIASREMALVRIDTRLDENSTGLRTPREVESLIARMDVVLTTRLHGTALAIKNGVPVIALDAIAGGAKVTQQAEALGWPQRFIVDRVSDQDLQEAFDFCLTADARALARECARRARQALDAARSAFLAEFRTAVGDAAG